MSMIIVNNDFYKAIENRLKTPFYNYIVQNEEFCNDWLSATDNISFYETLMKNIYYFSYPSSLINRIYNISWPDFLAVNMRGVSTPEDINPMFFYDRWDGVSLNIVIDFKPFHYVNDRIICSIVLPIPIYDIPKTYEEYEKYIKMLKL